VGGVDYSAAFLDQSRDITSPLDNAFLRDDLSHQFADTALLTPSPFRGDNRIPSAPIYSNGHYSQPLTEPDEVAKKVEEPAFAYDIEASLRELDSDRHWNSDPYFSLMLQPSFEALLSQPQPSENVSKLTAKLGSVHGSVRSLILSAPASDQAALVNVCASWARRVASDPLRLSDNNATPGQPHQQETRDDGNYDNGSDPRARATRRAAV